MPVGRWSLWRNRSAGSEATAETKVERRARQLLERYGFVFRDLLAREASAPAWRSLLGIYRRLEARGEIRGGRFVDGFVGEQFASPRALETLRGGRHRTEHEPVIVSAADPLNLVGIIVPGTRVSPYSTQAIAFQNGLAVEVGLLGELKTRLQHLRAPRPS
jgi:ATP-dependent Lhr-like helicase